MQKLLIVLVVIALGLGAFVVGSGIVGGPNRPKNLQTGQTADLRLRGTLLLNIEGSLAKYTLVGNGWQVYLDMSGLNLEDTAKIEPNIGKTVTVSGTQRHEVFLRPDTGDGEQPNQEADVLFAKSLSL